MRRHDFDGRFVAPRQGHHHAVLDRLFDAMDAFVTQCFVARRMDDCAQFLCQSHVTTHAYDSAALRPAIRPNTAPDINPVPSA